MELSFPVFYFITTLFARTCLSGPLHVFLSLFRPWVGFPLFRDPSLRPFLFCEPLFYFYEYGCGLWASSGPFPLLAHQGLYKRGRDPPTNPSRHLKKERVSLHLKWLLKEGQGGEPTDGYYVAYKPITLSYILFMFIEMKFIHCHSCVMFAMKSMSICND